MTDDDDTTTERLASPPHPAGERDGHGQAAGADNPPASLVVFGYLPGFAAGVSAGYTEGRRDLEAAKSEAAAAGFVRGKRAAEEFLPLRDRRPPDRAGVIGVIALSVLLGAALERRRQLRAQLDAHDQEGAGHDLSDLRD